MCFALSESERRDTRDRGTWGVSDQPMGLGHVRIDKSAPAPGVTAKLRLLATTDLHMHLTGFDYAHNTPDPEHGLTRTAALIAQARAEAEAEGHEVILLDNGDALQGTAIGDFSLAEPAADWQAKGRHPLMGAFDHLGYDAIGLGNHDFNYGLPALARVLQDQHEPGAGNAGHPAHGGAACCSGATARWQ